MTKDPLYLHHLSSVPLQEEGLRPRSQLLLLESKLPASNHSIYKFIAMLESRTVSIHNVLHVIVTNYCFHFSSAASSVKTLGLPSDQILIGTWRLLPINFVLSTLEMCLKKELECWGGPLSWGPTKTSKPKMEHWMEIQLVDINQSTLMQWYVN